MKDIVLKIPEVLTNPVSINIFESCDWYSISQAAPKSKNDSSLNQKTPSTPNRKIGRKLDASDSPLSGGNGSPGWLRSPTMDQKYSSPQRAQHSKGETANSYSPTPSPSRNRSKVQQNYQSQQTTNPRRTPKTNKTVAKMTPEILDALDKLAKAEKLGARDPMTASIVLWNLSKVLWNNQQTQATCRALTATNKYLRAVQESKDKKSSEKEPAKPKLNPRQVLKTRLQSGLSLARISVLSVVNAHTIEQKLLKADEVAKQVPRKFKKEEDLEEAISAMKEVTSHLRSLKIDYFRFVYDDENSTTTLSCFDTFCALCLITSEFAKVRNRPRDSTFMLDDLLKACVDNEHLPFSSDMLTITLKKGSQSGCSDGSFYLLARLLSDNIYNEDLVRAQGLCKILKEVSKPLPDFQKKIANFIVQLLDAIVGFDTSWLTEEGPSLWRSILAAYLKGNSASSLDNFNKEWGLISEIIFEILKPYDLWDPRNQALV
ncbi:hypothetical protein H4219_002124 [Mycoemilia scoparia]|uniref:Uncharacterized protein n=1 Tax=Mycoemilia scoparia TaxID=417184 RepID=A0A9W8DUS8_9FUNG|nr:hypothetical protein H4219_002124 [Mycoemilia scoparia]